MNPRGWTAAFAAAALAGCTAAPPVRQTGAAHPTIVSLNPCTDAILGEIAPPGQVLALSHYSRDPAASSMPVARAQRYGTTGGTVEEIAALAPDMVVASDFIAPATRAALTDMGIRVETFGIASTVTDSRAQVTRLAELTDRQREGAALNARIAAAVAPVADAPVSTVLWQPGGIVPGDNTLATELMARAGLASLSVQRGLRQADYLSLERLTVDPPRLLLVAGNERGQRHPALREIPGMEVARFDPSLLYCGGPTIIRAMKRLREIRAQLSPLPRAGGAGGGPATLSASLEVHPAATNFAVGEASLAAPPVNGRGG
ncbi:ABC transporter substrate-binding protein [Erythrobacter sp. 3-20A1M]|uniref:ABC transporter substrate-binding protein n=1 Tax=Erythrobacter sp. 3-20A1M TaxID=2653850 RepID=UPI00204092DB|nr:ABC transporter substrate-binding protein [Erythrobacter sp. 3-20A1M]